MILGFCGILFAEQLCLDYQYQYRSCEEEPDIPLCRARALLHTDRLLSCHGKSLADFLSTSLIPGTQNDYTMFQQLRNNGDTDIQQDDDDLRLIDQRHRYPLASLNPDQKAAFDTIIASLNTIPSTAHSHLFFVDGPGGCGKTFFYNILLAHVHSSGHKSIAVASTAMAALLLDGGTTAHSRFKVPVTQVVDDTITCNLNVHDDRQVGEIRDAAFDCLGRGTSHEPLLRRGR